MADLEDRYQQIPKDGIDSQTSTSRRWTNKVAVALIGGSCLGLVATMALSVSTSTENHTNSVESTSLFSLSSKFGLINSKNALPTFPRMPFSNPTMTYSDCQSWQQQPLMAFPQWSNSRRSLSSSVRTAASEDGAAAAAEVAKYAKDSGGKIADAAQWVSDALQTKGILVMSKSY
eukprot:gnl/MRDRNA2_/MRDRNA2_98440_c0_seq1.p1 gnl/MRDRNA2_/MRDRNA2_98440_c0~~gnl/MRDRNA2_/MRDRNA2_98440_c0_seq1.p1  ORF type:complete len:175 (+),score=30.41 gnl/MRDRNA2_/MRDRNA2_98440_c0_seq1:52-576(+)